MAKCLMAGLPAAGKTTYIAALSYLLQNATNVQTLRMKEKPADLSTINRLQKPWLDQRSVDRTSRGKVTDIELLLERISDNSSIEIHIPDIAGEDFSSILEKQSETINAWEEKPDSLIFLVKRIPPIALTESFSEDGTESKAENKIPKFTVQHIYEGVQNVLLIKELRRLFPWKRIAIGLTSWDLHNTEGTPLSYLEKECPFLFNFIQQYFPDAYVFGLSAQGWEYNDELNIDECQEKTIEGKRAFIIEPNGNKTFDITLPIDYLIS